MTTMLFDGNVFRPLAFTDEPLYQIYQAVALEKERTLSLKRSKKGDSGGTRGRTFTMGYGTIRSGKMLWSQLPEVSLSRDFSL